MTDISASFFASKSFPAQEGASPSADGNLAQSDCQKNLCIHQLVAAQAVAAPNALAVTQGKISLTYHELDQRASQLAHRLQSFGVGPDVLVAIYLNRSPAMIVAS